MTDGPPGGGLLARAVESLLDPRSAAAGGSAAAIAGALAATVLAQVARAGDDHGRGAQGAALQMRLARLAVGDADAFGVARTLLQSSTGGGDARRDFALERALEDAAAAPLAIAEACADVAMLAAELADSASPDLRPDTVSAGLLAGAAARAAAHLVEVNLGVAADDGRAVRARAAVTAAETAASRTL